MIFRRLQRGAFSLACLRSASQRTRMPWLEQLRSSASIGGGLSAADIHFALQSVVRRHAGGLPVPVVAQRLPDDVLEALEEGLLGFVKRHPEQYALTAPPSGSGPQILSVIAPPQGAVVTPPPPPPSSSAGAPATANPAILSGHYSAQAQKALSKKLSSLPPLLTVNGVFNPVQHFPPITPLESSPREHNASKALSSLGIGTSCVSLSTSDVHGGDGLSREALGRWVEKLHAILTSFSDLVSVCVYHSAWAENISAPESSCVDIDTGMTALKRFSDNLKCYENSEGPLRLVLAVKREYTYLVPTDRVPHGLALDVVEEYDMYRVARFLSAENPTSLKELLPRASSVTERDLLHVLLAAPHLFSLDAVDTPSKVTFILAKDYMPVERLEGLSHDQVKAKHSEVCDKLKSDEAGQFQLKKRLPLKRERKRLRVALATFENGISAILDFHVAAYLLYDIIGASPRTQDELEENLPRHISALTYGTILKFYAAFPTLFRVFELPPNMVVQCLDTFTEDATPEATINTDVALLDVVKAAVCEATPFASSQGRDPYITHVQSRLPKFAAAKIKKKHQSLGLFVALYPDHFHVEPPKEGEVAEKAQIRLRSHMK